MRKCLYDPDHLIPEGADPRRVLCSNACRQADYRRRVAARNASVLAELAALRTARDAA